MYYRVVLAYKNCCFCEWYLEYFYGDKPSNYVHIVGISVLMHIGNGSVRWCCWHENYSSLFKFIERLWNNLEQSRTKTYGNFYEKLEPKILFKNTKQKTWLSGEPEFSRRRVLDWHHSTIRSNTFESGNLDSDCWFVKKFLDEGKPITYNRSVYL